MKKLWVIATALALSLSPLAQDNKSKDRDKQDEAASAAYEQGAQPFSGRIDINNASKEELMKLKGVGDATADNIIAGRPYHAKSELLRRNILTPAIYNQIKDRIVAHRTEAGTPEPDDKTAPK